MTQWEYVKGNEADFEGAPEWATLSTRNYWYESGQQGKGRYLFRGKGGGEGMNPRLNQSTATIAERRKMPTDLYGTPLDLLSDHFKVPRDEIHASLQSRVNDANLGDALKEMFDTVQRPAHYNQSGIECIDAIAASMTPAEFQAYLKGNVQKYLWRYQHKNGVEDCRKAQWYLDRLVKELSK